MKDQDRIEGRDEMLARLLSEQAGSAVLNSRRILPKHRWDCLVDEARARFKDPASHISGAKVRLFVEDVLKREGVHLLSPHGLYILFIGSRIRRRGARSGTVRTED